MERGFIMKQIIITCSVKQKPENNLAAFFHGWLLNQLSPNFVTQIHQSGLNPISICVKKYDKKIHFIISLLNQEASKETESLLLSENLKEIELKNSRQKYFTILAKSAKTLEEKDLANIFYRNDVNNTFDIQFTSPTSFKSQGEYVFLPDLRLFFQSLMKKYSASFSASESIDTEMLEELIEHTKIVSYHLSSSYYKIHTSFVPGFIGRVRIRCKGNQTIANYLAMLLKFGEYSGVGIKTGMGMGAFYLNTHKN